MKFLKSNYWWITPVLVIIFWGISWLVVDSIYPSNSCNYNANRGAFGDKFGFINSLFSGLAFAGIVVSIFLQRKELSLQREELIETRKEFEEQNFQTSLFNLIKTQRQLGDEIEVTIDSTDGRGNYDTKTYNGRKFFIQSRKELMRIKEWMTYGGNVIDDYKNITKDKYGKPTSYTNDVILINNIYETDKYYEVTEKEWGNAQFPEIHSLQLGRTAYSIFFKKFHFAIGHYFRHLYHILNFISEQENERIIKAKTNIKDKEKLQKREEEIKKDFKTYANFVQAQMSTHELFLLFYNMLTFKKNEALITKYGILENLAMEDLLDEKDNCIKGITLKSRESLGYDAVL